MGWIYSVNRWYDDLDDTHPVARMFLFLVPLVIFDSLLSYPNRTVAIIGVLGLTVMAFVRVTPIFFPRGGR